MTGFPGRDRSVLNTPPMYIESDFLHRGPIQICAQINSGGRPVASTEFPVPGCRLIRQTRISGLLIEKRQEQAVSLTKVHRQCRCSDV